MESLKSSDSKGEKIRVSIQSEWNITLWRMILMTKARKDPILVANEVDALTGKVSGVFITIGTTAQLGASPSFKYEIYNVIL